MPPSAGMLAVDLTEDVNANQPIACGRQKVANCSKLIQPDDERHYILDKNDLTGKGTVVCSACYLYYEEKRGTLRATYVGQSVLTERINPSSSKSSNRDIGIDPMRSYYARPQGPPCHNALSSRGQMVDTGVISMAVNQAKRGGTAGGFRLDPQQSVTPLPHVIAGATASSSAAYSGPFRMPDVPAMSMAMPAALGYSKNHGVYHSERSRQSKKVYASQALSRAGNTINLIVQFGREVQAGGKTKLEIINVREVNNDIWAMIWRLQSHSTNTNYQGIQEGCDDVPVDSSIIQLCALVRNTLEHRVRQFFQGFALDINTLPIRNIPGWVDLTVHRDPMLEFYYKECHMLDKKGILVFKKPKLPFTLALVMTADQWEDFQTYSEHRLRVGESSNHGNGNFKLLPTTSSGSVKINPLSKRKKNAHSTASISQASVSASRLPVVTQTSDLRSSSDSDSEPETLTKESKSTAHRQPQKKRLRSVISTSNSVSHDSLSHPSQSGSGNIIRTPSPPQSTSALVKGVYTSPDRLRLREALISGGEMEFRAVEKYDPPKNVDYYDIESKPLDVLMEDCNRRFSIEHKNALRGSLAINSRQWIGQGAAKTTHSAILSIFNAPPSKSSSSGPGLGRKPNEPVVAKRFYIASDMVPKNWTGIMVLKEAKITRYSYEDERRKVEAEANLLYWASSLMSLANSWIKSQIAQRTINGDLCPLTIPDLRFVHGGVASVQGAYHTEPGKLFYQPNATYLIEELIPSALGEFTKYVHNVDATPQFPSFGGPAYETAEFLCFVQHLQYWKTDAMVYISDFQGAGHLLTDPQIMTSPSFEKSLFGDGNITEAFNDFPIQHMCNKFCEWFKLPSLPVQSHPDVQAETTAELSTGTS